MTPMTAAVYDRYGPPDVLRLETVPKPVPGPGDLLVRVAASSVTTADWRLRASAFPGILFLPGRLMTGLFRPKHRILGTEFAGTVAALGEGVQGFAPGDRVFGFCGHGGNAEFLTIAASGAIVATPASLTDAEAAALPFGAVSALVFLRDVAQVAPGQKVLVIGGSGGVGIYAIQIAAAMGAEVTAVASAENLDLLCDLGADRAIDYRATDVTRGDIRFDVIFDTVGAMTFPAARRILTQAGRFVPLNFTGREIVQAALAPLHTRQRMAIHVSGDSAEDLRAILQMVAAGTLRPVIDRRFALSAIAAAHAYVEARHRKGAVIIDIAGL